MFRPAHADYTYLAKYGVRDYRGGGRASARETAVRVVAAAIAKKYLRERLGCTVRDWLAQLGPLRPARIGLDDVDRNPFFSPDPDLSWCSEPLGEYHRSRRGRSGKSGVPIVGRNGSGWARSPVPDSARPRAVH